MNRPPPALLFHWWKQPSSRPPLPQYGKEDEGTEWRWPVPLVPAVCASEWASVAFVRPRMPLRPAEFPKDIAVNSMLQACHMHMSYCYL